MTVNINGIQTNYLALGEPCETAVVMLHGWASNSELFRASADTPQETEAEADSTELPIDPLSFNPDELNPFAPKTALSDTEEAQSPKDPGYQDEAGFFANYVESRWISRLRGLAEDPSAQQYFMLPERDFTALVSELATGARRLGIGQQIAKSCREAGLYADTRRDSIEWQQAGMAASIINSFVDWLGLNPRVLPEKERTFPSAGGKTVVLFTPPAPVKGFPKISEQRTLYTEAWYADWLKALYELVMGNLRYDGQKNINIEENSALKALINRFSAA